MKADQERIRTLLTDTVTLLCRNGLHYIKELKVEGLIGITLDGGEVFIVHINEKIVEDDRSCDVKFTRIEDSPSQCLQNFSTNQSAERKIKDSNSETVPLTIHSSQKKKRKYSSSSSVPSKIRQLNESSFEGTALQTVETIQNSSEEETTDGLVHVKEENRGGVECCKDNSIGEIVLLGDELVPEVNCKSKVHHEVKNPTSQMISKHSSSLDQPTSLKDSEDSNKISSAPIVGSMLKTSRHRKTGRMFSGLGGQESEFQGHSSNVQHQTDTDQGHQPVQLDVDGATFLNYSIDDEIWYGSSMNTLWSSGRRPRCSAEKSYMCRVPGCHRTFFRGSELYRHQRDKHGAQHVRPRGTSTWAHLDEERSRSTSAWSNNDEQQPVTNNGVQISPELDRA